MQPSVSRGQRKPVVFLIWNRRSVVYGKILWTKRKIEKVLNTYKKKKKSCEANNENDDVITKMKRNCWPMPEICIEHLGPWNLASHTNHGFDVVVAYLEKSLVLYCVVVVVVVVLLIYWKTGEALTNLLLLTKQQELKVFKSKCYYYWLCNNTGGGPGHCLPTIRIKTYVCI